MEPNVASTAEVIRNVLAERDPKNGLLIDAITDARSAILQRVVAAAERRTLGAFDLYDQMPRRELLKVIRVRRRESTAFAHAVDAVHGQYDRIATAMAGDSELANTFASTLPGETTAKQQDAHRPLPRNTSDDQLRDVARGLDDDLACLENELSVIESQLRRMVTTWELVELERSIADDLSNRRRFRRASRLWVWRDAIELALIVDGTETLRAFWQWVVDELREHLRIQRLEEIPLDVDVLRAHARRTAAFHALPSEMQITALQLLLHVPRPKKRFGGCSRERNAEAIALACWHAQFHLSTPSTMTPHGPPSPTPRQVRDRYFLNGRKYIKRHGVEHAKQLLQADMAARFTCDEVLRAEPVGRI